MVIKKSYCSSISVFLIIVIMMLVASAADELGSSSAAKFDPDYPIGTPPIKGGTGYVTESDDGDGWYNAIDWGVPYTADDPTLYGLYHAGEDWNDEGKGRTDVGDPVYAIAAGTVIDIRDALFDDRNGYGSGIAIEHTLPSGEKIYSVYEHIDIASGLSKGDHVWQGDRIGSIADITKLSPHLHFEIRTKWVEPGKRWYTNDVGGTAYYASKEDLLADGLIDPSDFIDSHRDNAPANSNQISYSELVDQQPYVEPATVMAATIGIPPIIDQYSLTQLMQNGDVIPPSGIVNDRTVAFKARLNHPYGENVMLQVELRRIDEYGGQFDDTMGGLKESDLVESGNEATTYAYGLIDGNYHWRARAVGEYGITSEWVDFSSNGISEADFTVSENEEQQQIAIDNDAIDWDEKGEAFYHQGRYEEAIQCFNEAIKIDPDYATAWNNKGAVLDELERYDEAIQWSAPLMVDK